MKQKLYVSEREREREDGEREREKRERDRERERKEGGGHGKVKREDGLEEIKKLCKERKKKKENLVHCCTMRY